MAEASHRASDAEREQVADRLRAAAAEGRLDPDELEERLGAAYAARTNGELAPLTGDLPAAAPAAPPAPPREAFWRAEAFRRRLATFIVINVVCIAVWLASGGPGDHGGFWPGWVLLGTGIGLFSMLVRGALGVEDDDHHHHGGRHGHVHERRDRRLNA